ncbi:YggT family protein [Sedimenticola thiotaurini]|uniref:Membrane protein n=1 Tax=Sedimenticola thiotaurini TaxID=1543721 RepID=A0A0F7JY39_9GAMM|nr:YggT family protein [Sedimenticola thiotaurini]AKH20602.1 membrane protein [Sedimenticola thiotaurini]
MGSNYLTDPLAFLIQVVFDLIILVVMLRFILQLVRANFYNPISQFAVKMTTPLLRPLRRIIPGVGGIDIASIILMILLKSLELILIMLVTGSGVQPLAAVAIALPELISLTINFFLIAILIQVILSWVNPGSYSPATELIDSITAPLLRPAQRLIPPIGGIDLSPMAVLVGLQLLKMLLIPPLQMLTATLLL